MLKIIKNQFREQIKFRKNDAESIPNASARIAADILKSVAFNCRCGEICIPTELVGDSYRCIRCGKEIVNSRYNLITRSPNSYNPFTNMDFYEAAMVLLKSDKKKRLTLNEIKYRLEH